MPRWAKQYTSLFRGSTLSFVARVSEFSLSWSGTFLKTDRSIHVLDYATALTGCRLRSRRRVSLKLQWTRFQHPTTTSTLKDLRLPRCDRSFGQKWRFSSKALAVVGGAPNRIVHFVG